MITVYDSVHDSYSYRGELLTVVERPLVERFALCNRTVCLLFLSILSVTLVYCGPNGWMD